VRSIARSKGGRARVAIRLRLTSGDYELARAADPNLPDIRHFIDTEQVGSSYEVAKCILLEALSSEELDVVGYHFHLGRLSREPSYHRWWSAGVAQLVRRLRDETGTEPGILNIGGGYAREREPEHGTSPLMNPYTIEEYAETVTAELLAVLRREGINVPELWLEPGRYLAGNAGVLLSTVGAVKTDVGMTWINVDASINDLPRVENAGWDYVALPSSRMDAPFEASADIVGSLCVGRHLKVGTHLPALDRGDTVAFLDVGAYAETASTQYNAVPRPATVLVSGDQSWLIKRRETVQDLYERHLIPSHLDQQPSTQDPRRSEYV
jgi:diaminopimelate decarboxylase